MEQREGMGGFSRGEGGERKGRTSGEGRRGEEG